MSKKILPVIAIAGVLAGIYFSLSQSGVLTSITDGAALAERLKEHGMLGPLAVVAFMALAVVMSPIPSAPIALASGAAFGHGWGTLYILLGAEAGALIAFAIARFLGFDVMKRWFGDHLTMGLFGSQVGLMGIVFASRLMPFISFDLISYAAGLTKLSLWRFAVATFAGTIPSSFLLAHFGGEMASGDLAQIGIAILVLGGMTFLTFGLHWVVERRRKTTAEKLGTDQSD